MHLSLMACENKSEEGTGTGTGTRTNRGTKSWETPPSSPTSPTDEENLQAAINLSLEQDSPSDTSGASPGAVGHHML